MKNNSKELIKNCLNSDETKEELENLKVRMNEENASLQDIIDDLSKICINMSATAGRRRKKFQECFDNDCRKLKQEVNRKRKAYQDALRGKLTEHETKLRTDIYLKTLNSYNALKRKKEKLFWQQKRESLRFLKTKNPKDFWKN